MRNWFWRSQPEKGYFLLEAIFLGIIVLAMTSGMLIYVQSRLANAEDGCRMQAAYLARYQIAAAEEKMSRGNVGADSLPWLGRDEDLQLGEVTYQVISNLSPYKDGKLLRVTVHWHKTDREGEVKLEKVIVRHE